MAELPGKNIRRPVTAGTRRPSGISPRPIVARPAEDEIESESEDAPIHRPNSGRRATRPSSPAAIPTSYKIGGIAAAVLLLVAIFGYGPFMRSRYINAIESAATLSERQQAADALYSRHDGAAYHIFDQRLGSTDPLTRDASAYGMSLIAQESNALGTSALEELTQTLPKLDAAGKCAFVERLGVVVKSITKDDADRKLQESDATRLAMMAAALLPETKNADAKVRSAAVETLAGIPSPGVCISLVAVATKDSDAGIKSKARKGLAFTALPEAAGALLMAVASSDKDLKNDAGSAFKKIRDKAKSDDLLPLVSSPEESVRREIVTALGKRPADSKAAEGVTKALKDTSADIRKLALKCIQVTGVSGDASQLRPLIVDADESVRVQCADTLGELRDEGSKKILVESFATNPQGNTLGALSKALGARSKGKDIPVIGVLIEQMNKHADGFAGIRDAVIKMTNIQNDPKREAERKTWDLARWNAWWENISLREKTKEEALTKLKTAADRGLAANKKDDKNDKKIYPELAKLTNDGFDLLEKCLELNKKDDSEDDNEILAIQKKYQNNKYTFSKYQTLDENAGKK